MISGKGIAGNKHRFKNMGSDAQVTVHGSRIITTETAESIEKIIVWHSLTVEMDLVAFLCTLAVPKHFIIDSAD